MKFWYCYSQKKKIWIENNTNLRHFCYFCIFLLQIASFWTFVEIPKSINQINHSKIKRKIKTKINNTDFFSFGECLNKSHLHSNLKQIPLDFNGFPILFTNLNILPKQTKGQKKCLKAHLVLKFEFFTNLINKKKPCMLMNSGTLFIFRGVF